MRIYTSARDGLRRAVHRYPALGDGPSRAGFTQRSGYDPLGSSQEVLSGFRGRSSTGSHLSVFTIRSSGPSAVKGRPFIDASDATLMRIRLDGLPRVAAVS